jgi:hypothetical protein
VCRCRPLLRKGDPYRAGLKSDHGFTSEFVSTTATVRKILRLICKEERQNGKAIPRASGSGPTQI